MRKKWQIVCTRRKKRQDAREVGQGLEDAAVGLDLQEKKDANATARTVTKRTESTKADDTEVDRTQDTKSPRIKKDRILDQARVTGTKSRAQDVTEARAKKERRAGRAEVNQARLQVPSRALHQDKNTLPTHFNSFFFFKLEHVLFEFSLITKGTKDKL